MIYLGEWILDKLYRPILFFFLLPIFYIGIGSTVAVQYNSLNFVSLIFLYLFVLIYQMLDNMLLRIPKSNFEISKGFLAVLELANILVLLFFGLRHSWLAALVLLFYTLIIQTQFIFSYYQLEEMAILIANLLKVVLLNGFAFYIQTQFIHPRFIPLFLGLYLPFYLFETSRGKTIMGCVWISSLLALIFAAGLGILWTRIGMNSLFLLLSLPFAMLFKVEFSRKTSAIFTCVYSLIFLVLIAVYL